MPKLIWEQRCGAANLRTVAFHPDGTLLVSAGADGMRIWDAETGQLRRHFGADAVGALERVQVLTDGRVFVVGEELGFVDGDTGAVTKIPVARRSDALYAASPDGAVIVEGVLGGNDLDVLDARSGAKRMTRSLLVKVPGPPNEQESLLAMEALPSPAVLAVDVSYIGSHMYWSEERRLLEHRTLVPRDTTWERGEVRAYGRWFRPSEPALELAGSGGAPPSWVGFHPSRPRVATIAEDGMLRMWEL